MRAQPNWINRRPYEAFFAQANSVRLGGGGERKKGPLARAFSSIGEAIAQLLA